MANLSPIIEFTRSTCPDSWEALLRKRTTKGIEPYYVGLTPGQLETKLARARWKENKLLTRHGHRSLTTWQTNIPGIQPLVQLSELPPEFPVQLKTTDHNNKLVVVKGIPKREVTFTLLATSKDGQNEKVINFLPGDPWLPIIATTLSDDPSPCFTVSAAIRLGAEFAVIL